MSVEDTIAKLEARIAELERKTAHIDVIIHKDPDFGDVAGVLFDNCRVSFNSDFHLRRNVRDSPLVTIGNNHAPIGLYVESEEDQYKLDGRPSVAIMANALQNGASENWAFHGVAFNSTKANCPYVGQVADRFTVQRYEGMQLRGSWRDGGYLIGDGLAGARKLWP
jgi:hypothetical protein